MEEGAVCKRRAREWARDIRERRVAPQDAPVVAAPPKVPAAGGGLPGGQEK